MRSIARFFFQNFISLGTDILCRIDKQDIPKIPITGPLILVINHVGSLEVPLLAVHLHPRKIIGLAKLETWDNKFMGWLFDLWDSIPIRRGNLDMNAIRSCLKVLRDGNILAVAPEGTRSRNGRLLRAQPGIVFLALHSGAPIIPIAHWGGEDFSRNLKKFVRTNFRIRVGRLFYLDIGEEELNAQTRQAIADEIMSQIAGLMPLEYRGEYEHFNPPIRHLRFV